MTAVIPREHVALMTDDELEWYLKFLAAIVDEDIGDSGPWVLQERQQQFEDATQHLDPTMSHEILVGGAAGPGKSEWGLWHLHDLALRFPGFKALALRRTFPELRRSLVLRSLERFDRTKARYVITENTWKFHNGSRIEFGYVESDNDVYQYQSAEYDCVFWDELTQWPGSPINAEEGFANYAYLYLFSRVRSRKSLLVRGYVPHVIAATNPGGVGGSWVKTRFVDKGPAEQLSTHALRVPGKYGTRIFIPGRLRDNKYIDPDSYEAQLANLGEELMRALLDGSWDVIEGAYFTEFNRQIHVIRPFDIPRWWARAGGIDYGYTAPWCTLHGAFDQDGTVYVYREHYATQLVPSMQCQRIKENLMAGEQIGYHVIDPSTFARTGVGKPIAQQYRESGIPVHRALNDRKSGWARVREYLRPVVDEHDGKTRAGIYIFDTCTDLIRTLPMLVHSKKDPEDLDTDGEDHAADALRYLLMSRPPRSRLPKPEDHSVEAQFAKRRRERERARRGDLVGADHPNLGRI